MIVRHDASGQHTDFRRGCCHPVAQANHNQRGMGQNASPNLFIALFLWQPKPIRLRALVLQLKPCTSEITLAISDDILPSNTVEWRIAANDFSLAFSRERLISREKRRNIANQAQTGRYHQKHHDDHKPSGRINISTSLKVENSCDQTDRFHNIIDPAAGFS